MLARKDLCMILLSLYDLLVINTLKKQYSFFSRHWEDLGICSVVHPRKNSQTYLQNIEVTLETFWKISMSSCHEVPNELSDLLAQVATCSTQTVNQNTNVAAEVCKVPIKRTSGLTVNIYVIHQAWSFKIVGYRPKSFFMLAHSLVLFCIVQ